MRGPVLWIVAVACLVVSAAAAAGAQGQPPVIAPGAFEPVSPDDLDQEQLPAAPLVFAAYAFVWLALLGYVVFLWRRLTQLQRELADISSRLTRRRP